MYIQPDANSDLLVEYYKEQNGRISLPLLLGDLEALKKSRVSRRKFDLTNQSQLSTGFGTLSRAALLSYNPPKADDTIERRYQEKIDKIKNFFFDNYK